MAAKNAGVPSKNAYTGIHEAIREAAKHAFQDHKIYIPPELIKSSSNNPHTSPPKKQKKSNKAS